MSLAEDAAARGVATEYEDWAGRPRQVPEDTVRAVLDAMEPYDDRPAPLVVAREGSPRAAGRPVGEYDGLLVAPRACPLPPRSWGWMTQLYALRSRSSWGMGDFTDLARLAAWSACEADAGFVLVNPLHAAAPGLPQEDSPYFPASRRYLNPLYLAIEDLPELALADDGCRAEVLGLGDRARALNAADLLDRDEVYRLKSRALELLFPWARGAEADDFAVWSALRERHGGPYQTWPADVRHPSAPGVARARMELADRVAFHAWVQMLCDEQLAEAQRCARDAGMPVGLVVDLAVGVDPGGADAWAQQDDLARGFTIGAPPDSFNQAGQDWRLPPWRPDRLRASGYAPYRALVRAMLRHAGGIRIDHAMGLWRLYWVPEGAGPTEGTYVSYDADDLLGILAYECHAASAIAVAEDLGTVPRGVPETLRANGILSSAVLWFSDGGPETYPEQAFTSVTTHDLPTARGFWLDDGGPNAADRTRVLALLSSAGLPTGSVDECVASMHAFIARTPSLLAAVSLGDAVGEERQPNRPGTAQAEYPNWRLPLPVTLEDLATDPHVAAVVSAVRRER